MESDFALLRAEGKHPEIEFIEDYPLYPLVPTVGLGGDVVSPEAVPALPVDRAGPYEPIYPVQSAILSAEDLPPDMGYAWTAPHRLLENYSGLVTAPPSHDAFLWTMEYMDAELKHQERTRAAWATSINPDKPTTWVEPELVNVHPVAQQAARHPEARTRTGRLRHQVRDEYVGEYKATQDFIDDVNYADANYEFATEERDAMVNVNRERWKAAVARDMLADSASVHAPIAPPHINSYLQSLIAPPAEDVRPRYDETHPPEILQANMDYAEATAAMYSQKFRSTPH